MDAITTTDVGQAATVRVWDRFVRISHWLLVAGFGVAFVWEEGDLLHQVAGYLAAGVATLRIVWGFIGPEHARFENFVPGPMTLLSHLRDVVTFRDRRHLGHNPAVGAMAVVLLGLMLALGVTGWMMTSDAWFGAEWVEELHEGAANAALALVFLHVAGAIYESIRHRENLPWAMVTGRKRP